MEQTDRQQRLAALQTFNRLFPTEEDCIGFLFPLRWPRGFVCPLCRACRPELTPRRYPVCPHCGNRSSLTTGTLMHGAKKPLRDWLLAIWWFSGASFDVSAKDLQRLLGISCYQTAWTWLQKLRLAMGRADDERVRGAVEIGCGTAAPAHERKECALVLIAAEIALAPGGAGRIRMRHIARLDAETLQLFLQDAVENNSRLLAGDQQMQAMLNQLGARHVAPIQPEQLSQAAELARSFETCLHTVHRGGVTIKHLQLYLDEFCFRNNAALRADHLAVFKSLLAGVLDQSIQQFRHAVQGGGKIDDASPPERRP